MHGPWYTFEDALDILSLRRAELLHLIDTDAIKPVVDTQLRSFLVVKEATNNGWIGVGTCNYHGCLKTHKSYISTLLQGKEVRLKGLAIMLEPSKVQRWNPAYPYKTKPPFENIYSWKPLEWDDVDSFKLAVSPKPSEAPSTKATLDKLAGILTNTDRKSSWSNDDIPNVLNFHSNSLFTPSDLRIPGSEIKRYQASITAVKEPAETKLSEQKEIGFPKLPGKRVNQLHQLIFNTLSEHPDTGPTELWEIIQSDYESDTPRYDTDSILRAMDSSCINWESRKGVPQTMQWNSFESRVSELKQKLLEVTG